MSHEIRGMIQNEWHKDETKSTQLAQMLFQLEDISDNSSDDDIDLKDTTAYILLEQKLEEVKDKQTFLEKLLSRL